MDELKVSLRFQYAIDDALIRSALIRKKIQFILWPFFFLFISFFKYLRSQWNWTIEKKPLTKSEMVFSFHWNSNESIFHACAFSAAATNYNLWSTFAFFFFVLPLICMHFNAMCVFCLFVSPYFGFCIVRRGNNVIGRISHSEKPKEASTYTRWTAASFHLSWTMNAIPRKTKWHKWLMDYCLLS